MFLTLVKFLGIIFYWTWFIWPPVFVFCLIRAIANAVRAEVAKQMGQEPPTPDNGPPIFATIALLLMLCSIAWPLLEM